MLASDRDGIVDALETIGIPALLLERAGTVDDIYDQMETLGAATGHEAEAAAVVEQMRRRHRRARGARARA